MYVIVSRARMAPPSTVIVYTRGSSGFPKRPGPVSIFQIIFCPGGMEGMTRSTTLASACSHCPPKLFAA